MYSSISGHSVENWSSEKPGSPKFEKGAIYRTVQLSFQVFWLELRLRLLQCGLVLEFFFVLVSAFEDCNNFFLFFRAFVRYILQYYILGLSRVVCFQNSAHLTMTGFSDPATNPNPSSGSRLNSTVLGSGTSFGSIGIHFRGSS